MMQGTLIGTKKDFRTIFPISENGVTLTCDNPPTPDGVYTVEHIDKTPHGDCLYVSECKINASDGSEWGFWATDFFPLQDPGEVNITALLEETMLETV